MRYMTCHALGCWLTSTKWTLEIILVLKEKFFLLSILYKLSIRLLMRFIQYSLVSTLGDFFLWCLCKCFLMTKQNSMM